MTLRAVQQALARLGATADELSAAYPGAPDRPVSEALRRALAEILT